MARIFISHVRADARLAAALQRFLQQELETDDIFLSSNPWQIYAGEDWLRRLTDELRSASVVVLMLSTNSLREPWVNFEAGGAWLAGKVVIPICFGGVSKENLPKPYSNLQALNLRDDYIYLVTSLQHHLPMDLTSRRLASTLPRSQLKLVERFPRVIMRSSSP